jgi:hypothetical protein
VGAEGLGNAVFCATGAEGTLDWAEGALLWAAAQPSITTIARIERINMASPQSGDRTIR